MSTDGPQPTQGASLKKKKGSRSVVGCFCFFLDCFFLFFFGAPCSRSGELKNAFLKKTRSRASKKISGQIKYVRALFSYFVFCRQNVALAACRENSSPHVCVLLFIIIPSW
jgi:hypothetical protein